MYECDPCDRTFLTNYSYLQHVTHSIVHRRRTNAYFCDRCELGIPTLIQMEAHLRDEHFWCKQHDLFFQNETNLRAHLNSASHLGRTIPCALGECSQTFPTASARILHYESGTCPSGINLFKLERNIDSVERWSRWGFLLLDYEPTFTPLQSITVRERRAWGSVCEVCDRDFETRRLMNMHFTAAHLTKEVIAYRGMKYYCPLADCPDEFKLFSGLVQHLENGACARRANEYLNDLDRLDFLSFLRDHFDDPLLESDGVLGYAGLAVAV